jgi:hypothetical protein
MSNKFTIEEVTLVQRGTNLPRDIFCTIKFAEVSYPVAFFADAEGLDPFQVEMNQRCNAGEFGEVLGVPSNYPRYPKTQTELEIEARAQRDDLLLKSDYIDTAITQARLNDAEKTAWANYRQSLRDVSSQSGFPYEVIWPTKP